MHALAIERSTPALEAAQPLAYVFPSQPHAGSAAHDVPLATQVPSVFFCMHEASGIVQICPAPHGRSGAQRSGGAQPGDPKIGAPGGHTHAPFTHDAVANVPSLLQQPCGTGAQS